MKSIKHILCMVLIVITTNLCYGQQYTHIHNNDVSTRALLTQLTTKLTTINVELGLINNRLRDAKEAHRDQLDLQYTKNKYDRSNSFIASSVGSAALSFGPSMLANTASLPYMTEEKKDYLNQIAMDKAILLSLQVVSTHKIKSSKRQEIYRLRNKLLKEFSKTDKNSRSLLYLPVGALVITKYQEFSEIVQMFKDLAIVL